MYDCCSGGVAQGNGHVHAWRLPFIRKPPARKWISLYNNLYQLLQKNGRQSTLFCVRVCQSTASSRNMTARTLLILQSSPIRVFFRNSSIQFALYALLDLYEQQHHRYECKCQQWCLQNRLQRKCHHTCCFVILFIVLRSTKASLLLWSIETLIDLDTIIVFLIISAWKKYRWLYFVDRSSLIFLILKSDYNQLILCGRLPRVSFANVAISKYLPHR